MKSFGNRLRFDRRVYNPELGGMFQDTVYVDVLRTLLRGKINCTPLTVSVIYNFLKPSSVLVIFGHADI